MPLALAIAALWMLGGFIVDHFLWHPTAAYTYDIIHNQYVQATEGNKYYTFEGYLDTGLIYNYSRDGMFAYFQERTGCLAIAEADVPAVNSGTGDGRCVSHQVYHNLSYFEGQEHLLKCRELWPTQWPTSCALGKQTGPV